MIQNIRIARPVSNLARAVAMYTQGLELQVIGRFEGHDGFDGVMLRAPGRGFHFEFTHCRSHPVRPAPTPEDLVVFYLPGDEDWRARCAAMAAAGFRAVEPFNPYWGRSGRSFEDFDGYRVVIQRAAWEGTPEPE